jgi:glycosyltransferase involved in cell wall biosynthesis
MNIGIDANEANVNKKVGISEFAFELLTQFAKPGFKKPGTNFTIYLKDNPLEALPKPTTTWRYRVLKPGKLWTQWRLPLDLYITKPRPSVFFSTTHYAPRFSPIPTVISIMDLAYIYFPQMFNKSDLYQLRSWTSYSAKNAKKIITISESSKSDIIKQYQIPEEKVEVVYPGIKPGLLKHHTKADMDTLKTKYGINDTFILFVGTLQPRKNISRLIEAFSKVIQEQNDIELIIIGKKGWLYEEILKKPHDLGIEDKVKFLDFVTDSDLEIFYREALCFVLPSLYEGFGLPVLEAMKYGCPVITSNVSSLPEAGGEAALYVDPLDTNDIAQKIKKLITNPQLRKELKEKGKTQLAKFSWEKTAKKTQAILEEVAKQ